MHRSLPTSSVERTRSDKDTGRTGRPNWICQRLYSEMKATFEFFRYDYRKREGHRSLAATVAFLASLPNIFHLLFSFVFWILIAFITFVFTLLSILFSLVLCRGGGTEGKKTNNKKRIFDDPEEELFVPTLKSVRSRALAHAAVWSKQFSRIEGLRMKNLHYLVKPLVRVLDWVFGFSVLSWWRQICYFFLVYTAGGKLLKARLDPIRRNGRLFTPHFESTLITNEGIKVGRKKLLEDVLDDSFARAIKISLNQLVLSGGVLGAGSYGSVFEGRYYGHLVAIKIVEIKNRTEGFSYNALWNECCHHVCMNKSQNLIQCYGHNIFTRESAPHLLSFMNETDETPMEKSYFCLVTERMDCNVQDFVWRHRKCSVWKKREICIMMARGLHSLHLSNCIHRDVKAKNFLVSYEFPPFRVVLTDYGLSRFMQKTSRTSRNEVSTETKPLLGPIAHSAPEVSVAEDQVLFTKASDVYSLGVTFTEVLFERHPYDLSRFSNSASRIIHLWEMKRNGVMPNLSLDDGLKSHISVRLMEHFIPLLEDMLATDPLKRPSVEQVIERLEEIEIPNRKRVEHVASLGQADRDDQSGQEEEEDDSDSGADGAEDFVRCLTRREMVLWQRC